MSEVAVSVAEPVRVPKAAELVAARIRARIVRGELAEGDTLPSEAELSAEFQISRPTLREALRILESESLISVSRGARSGATVHLPSEQVAARYMGVLLQVRGTTLADIYEARLSIFPPAARAVADRGDAGDLAALGAALDELRRLEHDPAAFLPAAAQFNLTLLGLAGNTTRRVIAGMLDDIVERHLQTVARDWLDNPRHAKESGRVLSAIERLVGLIEAGKGAEAERFWRGEMETSAEYMLKRFGARIVDLLE